MSKAKYTKREHAAIFLIFVLLATCSVSIWFVLAPESWLTRLLTLLICAVALVTSVALTGNFILWIQMNRPKKETPP